MTYFQKSVIRVTTNTITQKNVGKFIFQDHEREFVSYLSNITRKITTTPFSSFVIR